MGKTRKETLPKNIALDSDQQKDFNRKVTELKQKNQDEGSGVVYIGHIPHGFFEEQMKGYFEQFGKVRRLRISRSKKTGNIRGYAFVQFIDDEVAKVVADSMNNYLMFHKLLKCQYVPLSKLHPETFKGADRAFTKPKAHRISAQRHNKEKTEEKLKRSLNRAKARKAKSLAKLADLGIDFEYPGLVKIEGKRQEEQMEAEDNMADSDNMADMEVVDTTLEGDTSLDNSLKHAAMSFLLDDSDDDEIKFPRTPPGVRRKSLSDLKMTPNPSKSNRRKSDFVRPIKSKKVEKPNKKTSTDKVNVSKGKKKSAVGTGPAKKKK